MEIIIRQENSMDKKEIYAINTLAFGKQSEAKLVNLLRNSDAFIPELSLVALLENKIVGHILFNKIKIVNIDNNEVESLALAPMAVSPALQRNNIGSQLVKAGLNQAKALNFKSVIVLGHKNYYPKFGFVPAIKWNIISPFNVPNDVFMAIELQEGSLKNVSGLVKYPKEFDTL